MTAGATTQHWYRIAGLRPRLRDQARIHRHRYRGELWYVLQDRASTRYYRFGPGVRRLLSLLDGERTVQEAWQTLETELGDEAPSQDEIVRLLSSLYTADLLHTDTLPDHQELSARQQDARRSRWKRYVRGPFVLRLPLFDPDALLERWTTLSRVAFGRAGLIAWLAIVMLGTLLTWAYWPQIGDYWVTRGLTAHNLLLLALTYPLVKGLHEFAHGLAVKHRGGEVHETGVMFLVFMPVPYVDASAASAFPDKHHRMLVGAAGIMAELLLASLAVVVWLSVETGLVRDIAYNVMLIGGISTVLFNGNPLLRFDGYYVLADAIEIPNLAQRSTQYYGFLFQRYLLGATEARSPATASGERAWFATYGLAAPIYRVFILFAIILFVAQQSAMLGLLLGLIAVAMQLVRPLAVKVHAMFRSPALRTRRMRVAGVLTLAAAGLAVAVLFVPIPSSTYAEGIVWLPEHAHVRAGSDGFVQRIVADENAPVQRGDVLIETHDPLLRARVEVEEWKLRELEARRDAEIGSDQVQVGILEDYIRRARADLDQTQRQARELIARSPASGTFVVPGAHRLPGRFVRKGEVVAYVTDPSACLVRVVVDQRDAGRVQESLRSVRVRLADQPTTTIAAVVEREVPSATTRLPARALGTLGGGRMVVDTGDPDGMTAVERIFVFDLTLPADAAGGRLGTRAHVRFEHAPETLARQGYRALRQLLLRRLAV